MTKTPLITAACGPSAMASRVQARNTGTATFWVAAGAETALTVATGTTTLATASEPSAAGLPGVAAGPTLRILGNPWPSD